MRVHYNLQDYQTSQNRNCFPLEAIPLPRDLTLAATVRRARDLSRAFDAWDCFDHATALKLLDAYRPKIGQTLAAHFNVLGAMVRPSPKQEPLQLLDLWRNTKLRATQGRYDDAVARVYRLLEWIAQWLLREHCGLEPVTSPLTEFRPA